jgi:hypothetical protein
MKSQLDTQTAKTVIAPDAIAATVYGLLTRRARESIASGECWVDEVDSLDAEDLVSGWAFGS